MEMNKEEKAVQFHLWIDNGACDKYLNEQEVQQHIKYLEGRLKSEEASCEEWRKRYWDEFTRFQDACYAMQTMLNVSKEIVNKYTDKIKVWENEKL